MRCYLRLADGEPSRHDRFRRVMAALDALQFEACFVRQATSVPDTRG
ncbi:hypothetical protein [Paraburkholderia sp.]|nr:hypothetical protein [Paraburkholderia sp.]HZZ06627.1 hypothetical protein [Paraburkholderia sp.]